MFSCIVLYERLNCVNLKARDHPIYGRWEFLGHKEIDYVHGIVFGL